MPRKPRKPIKKRQKNEADTHIVYFLKFGEPPPQDLIPHNPFDLLGTPSRAAWNACRDRIMAEWLKERPGTRPHGWWTYEAPRQPAVGDGSFYDGKQPVLRERKPALPEDHFISGGFFGTYTAPLEKGVVEFESEASYLKRHGLFAKGEERRLKSENFEPYHVELT